MLTLFRHNNNDTYLNISLPCQIRHDSLGKCLQRPMGKGGSNQPTGTAVLRECVYEVYPSQIFVFSKKGKAVVLLFNYFVIQYDDYWTFWVFLVCVCFFPYCIPWKSQIGIKNLSHRSYIWFWIILDKQIKLWPFFFSLFCTRVCKTSYYRIHLIPVDI